MRKTLVTKKNLIFVRAIAVLHLFPTPEQRNSQRRKNSSFNKAETRICAESEIIFYEGLGCFKFFT